MAENTTAAEWITLSVDIGVDNTTVYSAPCLLRGYTVTSVLSAHDVLFKDGTAAAGTIVAKAPASAGVGTTVDLLDMRIENKLVIDPDDSGVGTINVIYKPFNAGAVGSGAGLP